MKRKELITTIITATILLAMSYMFSQLKDWNKNRLDNEIILENINNSIEKILKDKKEISKLEKIIDLNGSGVAYQKVVLKYYIYEVKEECFELKKFNKVLNFEVDKYCDGIVASEKITEEQIQEKI